MGVYHRGPDSRPSYDADTGGSWTGDHDLNCGDPSTQRRLSTGRNDPQPTRVANSIYTCRDHIMTSMGQVDGYSIVWFSPDANRDKQPDTFSGARTVSWDVNVTDLLGRQWWEISIVPVGAPYLATVDWMAQVAEIPAYDPRTVVVGNGPLGREVNITTNAQQRYTNWQKNICDRDYPLDREGCASKAIRRPFSITDNGNGTLTVQYGGMFTQTVPGSFPSQFQVFFKDHNYTPDKDGTPQGHTWHWDNIIVK